MGRTCRIKWLICLVVVAVLAIDVLLPGQARAGYPEKPVTLIVIFSAGGANDIVARAAAESMKKHFPRPIAVVNRPGAVGTIGTSEIVRARADGYTIGLSTRPALTMQPHRTKLPYNTPDDYTPIILLGRQPFILAVNKDAPWAGIKEFVQDARANPGKLRVTGTGIGSVHWFLIEELKARAQVNLTHVPQGGGGEMVAALLGKHFEAAVLTPSEALPQVRAGRLRVLGVFEEKRNPLFPDAATFLETGLEIAGDTYAVIIAPKELPAEIATTLYEAFKKVTEDPAFVKSLEAQGFAVAGEGAPQLAKRLWKDYRDSQKLFDRLGLRRDGS